MIEGVTICRPSGNCKCLWLFRISLLLLVVASACFVERADGQSFLPGGRDSYHQAIRLPDVGPRVKKALVRQNTQPPLPTPNPTRGLATFGDSTA